MNSRDKIIKICTDLQLSKKELSLKIGVEPQRLYDIQSGRVRKISRTVAEKISYTYPQYTLEWLLSDEMLIGSEGGCKYKREATQIVAGPHANSSVDGGKALPLIPIEAMAGFPVEETMGVRIEDCECYSVPEFAARGAQFLIRVSGSSMYPKYSNGDVLACRKVEEVTFFQWGKVYVLDTNQGAIVKRLFPDKESADRVICHSDNTENYPDFTLNKEDIRSLSIVVGVIRLD